MNTTQRCGASLTLILLAGLAGPALATDAAALPRKLRPRWRADSTSSPRPAATTATRP
jgi:hypothetical protein